jgi:hypothetical protein
MIASMLVGWLRHPRREAGKVNIDGGGLGIGVYDRLIEQGHDNSLVDAVNFGGKPIDRSLWTSQGSTLVALPIAGPNYGLT